ncbi:uncharacterized protein LOC107041441 [Diachasma alloeum]|uniref:uncharacterized protein LOC107041441 n=1 Tax=Diachasma alloeum TaxID=454923 RepID=UPI0007384999|nr:uncharacterized protein LOC107041441 [Diachasma alloeum]
MNRNRMGKSKKRQCNLKKFCSSQSRSRPRRKSPARPKKPESRAIFSTKVETWRSHGEKAYCPICKKPVVPVVLEKRRRVTSSGFAAICLLGCWPLCALFPLKGDSSALQTRCPICGYEYRSLDHVKVISPSKASSTSTLSNSRDKSHCLLNTQMNIHSQRALELHDKQLMEIDSKRTKTMESASVQTHLAVERIDHTQPSDGCGCHESADISEKLSSYRLVEEFEHYRHQNNASKLPQCGFLHHRCNPRPCATHDTKLPMVTMSHDGGVRRTNSVIYGNKNCNESTCNEDQACNRVNWTDNDCRISWPAEDTCCQGRLKGDGD